MGRLHAQAPLAIPLHVAGATVTTAEKLTQHMPAAYTQALAVASSAGPGHVADAIEAALVAKPRWEALPFADRAAVFLRAAELVAGKHRHALMAATMLGQGKNVWQAEIDAAAELADFLRFNVAFAEQLYAQQPAHHAPGV